MGDLEFDAMDDMDYSEESFESHEGDDGGRVDALESSKNEVDMVADLLMGNEPGEATSKASRTGFRTHDLDDYGNIKFDDGGTSAEAPKQSGSPYGFDATTPSGTELMEERSQAEDVWAKAHAAKAEIEQALARGDITDAQAQEALHTAGMYAGQARAKILENELMMRNLKDYHKEAYATIASEFDIDPNDPQAVNVAMGEAVSFLKAQGIQDADIATIEDPAIAITAIRAHRAIERDSAQRDEIAGLKAQVRRLKKAQGEGRRKGRKASQMGSVDRQSSMLDEVAALLSGGES